MARVGRPTKYNDRILKKFKDYYKECLADENKVPFMEEVALKLWVNRDTIYQWAKETRKDEQGNDYLLHQEFSDTLKMIQTLQEIRLSQIGVKDQRNVVAIFLLKAKHGYVETEKRIVEDPAKSQLANELGKYTALLQGNAEELKRLSESKLKVLPLKEVEVIDITPTQE